ncbi:MAG TPA: hypothetical protein VFE62_08010 [Gemmataceae bacterium]|nr:hypothetical protein [Gemmataceae bacterium]
MEMAAPKDLVDILPENLRAYALYILGGAACIGVLFVLIILAGVVRLLLGGKKEKPEDRSDLTEDLTTYPDLKSRPGDTQLRAEGSPVRLRLVVLAPAGNAEIDEDSIPKILEEVVAGMGAIYKNDKPRVKIWPKQVSYQGFATFFHSHTETGASEKEQTRWVLVAGRIKVGKTQYMLGLGMQTIKPNPIGRRTVDAHEWSNVLRVRVRD